MAIGDMIRKNITYCEPSTPVCEVAQIMKEDDVGAVLVLEAGVPVGVVTDRDVVLRCLAEKLDPKDTPAENIMTSGVETVREDQGVYQVVEAMRDSCVRRVAIVDDAGNAVGLISFDDVFDLLTQELNDLREAVQPRRPKILTQVA